MFKRKKLKSDPSFIKGSACEILGIEPVSVLKEGMDFRDCEYRREVFLRFYEFHLENRSHPGGVYFLMPYLAKKFNWDMEQKLWYAFINGTTQNPCTSWVIFNKFPDPHKIKFEEFETWHHQYWKRLDFDIDRRYIKGHSVELWQDYIKNLNGKTQVEFFNQYLPNENPEDNFYPLWEKIYNDFFMFGRLSTFSYMEYLKIMGLNVDCNYLFMDDLEGSKSHRNGICKVLGRDDLDWYKENPGMKGHTQEIVNWAEEEAHKLLLEAKERFKGRNFFNDVNYFTLESTLCCYKSWHRPNRRYPNIYMDMMFDRIKKAERSGWEDHGINFDIFWEARKECLPKHLRLEDNPKDIGLKPEKMNHYRLTGQVIMMDKEWGCFKNDYNNKVNG